MARKCNQQASFSKENLFFEDYSFGSLMTDVFLDWFWNFYIHEDSKSKKVHGTFGLKILGTLHCVSPSSTSKHFDILRLPLILIGAAEFAVASWFRVRKDCLRHFSIDYDAHGSILRASSDLLFVSKYYSIFHHPSSWHTSSIFWQMDCARIARYIL